MIDLQNKITASINNVLESHNNYIKSSLDALRDDLSVFKQQLHDMKLTTEKLSDEQTTLKNDICLLKSSMEQNNLNFGSISKDMYALQSTVNNLSEQQQAREQQGRVNNIEISGLPFTKGENLLTIVHNIATKIGFPLASSDIDYIHRVRRFNTKSNDNTNIPDGRSLNLSSIPNIIVRFTQRKRKSDMLAAVRARRGLTTVDAGVDGPSKPIFISDHLSPHNKLLYKQVRLIAKEKSYKYVWLSDCKIFVRKNDESKALLVASEVDLTRIK